MIVSHCQCNAGGRGALPGICVPREIPTPSGLSVRHDGPSPEPAAEVPRQAEYQLWAAAHEP